MKEKWEVSDSTPVITVLLLYTLQVIKHWILDNKHWIFLSQTQISVWTEEIAKYPKQTLKYLALPAKVYCIAGRGCRLF